jgi:long-chain fatty acid transport protein
MDSRWRLDDGGWLVNRLIIIVACALLIGVGSSPVSANPVDTIGFGSRSTAMAGAVSAHVSGPSANYYNPAGLVGGDGLRLSVGYQFSINDHSVNGVSSNLEPVRGINVGIAAPVEIAGVRVGFGLGLHLNDSRLSRTRSALITNPRWELYDTRPHRVWLAACAAIQPFDWLLIGGGITFQSASDLRLSLRGDAHVIRPESASRLEHEFQGDLRAIRYPVLGVQFIPTDTLRFAVAYRGEYSLKNYLQADVDIDFTGLGADVPGRFTLGTESVASFGPQHLVLGTTLTPTPRWTLSMDLTWVNWSAYLSPVADEDVALRIDVPPELEGLISVPGQIVGRESSPLGFQDRWVPRLGVEWFAMQGERVDLHLRAGYFYERSAFPEQTGDTSFLDSDRHGASVGMGVTVRGFEPTLDGFLRFDVHLQYNHIADRNHVRSSLVNVVGDLNTSGQQFAGSIQMELGFE